MKKIFLFLAVCLALFCGCTTVSMNIPDGFALLDKEAGRIKAVSPEGLRLELRREPNLPEKDLVFWQEAYTFQMKESGYQSYTEPVSFTTSAGEGFYAEWAVPYLGETWIYMNAVTLKDNFIVIAEAAGPIDLYSIYKDQVIESLGSIE